MSDFTIRPLSPIEVQTAVNWAADEGWNPGLSDAESFLSVDASGFWGGFLKGEMIASISVVNYDEHFAFLGFYIVHPEYRGEGYGLELWMRAIKHAGNRLVGLDGVVQEQDNYRKSGFDLAYRNIRQGGTAQTMRARLSPAKHAPTAPEATPAGLMQYDRALFPAPRAAFLERWNDTPGHITRIVQQGDAMTGYAALRPCRDGYKIGPLFADDRPIAEALLTALLDEIPESQLDQPVYLDTPEPNTAALELAKDLHMTPVFETARMYTGPAPDIDLTRVFGVTSFELG